MRDQWAAQQLWAEMIHTLHCPFRLGSTRTQRGQIRLQNLSVFTALQAPPLRAGPSATAETTEVVPSSIAPGDRRPQLSVSSLPLGSAD